MNKITTWPIPKEFRPKPFKRGLPESDGCPLRSTRSYYGGGCECGIDYKFCGDMCPKAVWRMIELLEPSAGVPTDKGDGS